jgi:hypothetical protein
MKGCTAAAAGLLVSCLWLSLWAAEQAPILRKTISLPLAFTKNMGQWDKRVLFCATSGGVTMWFTKEGVTYQFTRRTDTRNSAVSAPSVGQNRFGCDAAGLDSRPHGNDEEVDSVEQLVITAKFVGANPDLEVDAEGQMDYRCNYFLSNDPARWHTDVPNFEAITLKDIYPGINLKYSSDGNDQAAYEFIAAPGVDLAQVKVVYDGVESTSLDSDGRMILKTKWGDLIAAIDPTTDVSGLVSTRFVANAEKAPTITGGSQSLSGAKSGALTLAYSTYLGGIGVDWGYAIAVNDSGSAFVTGSTYQSDFPTQNPYQYSQANGDVFVTKFSSSGNSLIYSTYLGGSDYENGSCIVVDASGNAFVTGSTVSLDFPTLNPYQIDQSGDDVFVTKLSSSGSSLIYSTYLGGSSTDAANGIEIDDSGHAYVTGLTGSFDFPILDPYQPTNHGCCVDGGGDAFVTKLSNTGHSLIYSTYLGGGSNDAGCGIGIDDSGNAYVTGWTYSSDFPTLNPYQGTFQGGDYDAFVTKLSISGNTLIYSTYLGGGSGDNGLALAIDSSGNAYVTGRTFSADFPTLNPYQAMLHGGYYGADAIVAKFSSFGNLIYGTYLGGNGDENMDGGGSIAIDEYGNAYVTGSTESSNFPTLNPYQTDQGSTDVFVTELSSNGRSLIYSTYLGGSGGEGGNDIEIDDSGNAFVTGYTYNHSSFPTQNPFQAEQGGYDAFITKLSPPPCRCGDANNDMGVDISDAVYLIAYIFSGGPAPNPVGAGDANCDSAVDISDAVYLIAFIFSGGPEPCASCK